MIQRSGSRHDSEAGQLTWQGPFSKFKCGNRRSIASKAGDTAPASGRSGFYCPS